MHYAQLENKAIFLIRFIENFLRVNDKKINFLIKCYEIKIHCDSQKETKIKNEFIDLRTLTQMKQR